MAPALFAYTLPTLQLVCHLVTMDNSSIDATTSPGAFEVKYSPGDTSLARKVTKRRRLAVNLNIRSPGTEHFTAVLYPRDHAPLAAERLEQLLQLLHDVIEPPTTTSARTLPPGYVAYSDFGVAYKVSNTTETWDTASNQCARDGAYLGQIDSTAKIELLKHQQPSTEHNVHVGYHLKISSDSIWYSVHTRLPVSKLPWSPGEPSGDGRCVKIGTSLPAPGLGRYDCDYPSFYVCEISYP